MAPTLRLAAGKGGRPPALTPDSHYHRSNPSECGTFRPVLIHFNHFPESTIMTSAADVARHGPVMGPAAAELTPTRRTFLAQAASSAVLAATIASAFSQSNDPIFEAIEQHRLAHQRHWASLGEDELEDTIPKERRLSSWHDAMHDEPDWRVLTDDPVWIAHIEEGVAAWSAELDAAGALINILPTTPAGVLALLQYSIEADPDGEEWRHEFCDDGGKARSWHRFLIANLVEVLPGMVSA
jgi:hypothetical protein